MTTTINDHSVRAVLVLLALGPAEPTAVLRPHTGQLLHSLPAPGPSASAAEADGDGER
ncbi:hypothetical protein HCK01_33640 [Streptomyces sp. AA8]|uniref:hypothetical protein n=1 Tax=Streptomyces telluris TaxID=2720021 RepID=UPI00143C3ED5|nr:hypothetical protein [Streptomyces telluris]NJP82178.1 hypothetical protein [Streptomyces telluris]